MSINVLVKYQQTRFPARLFLPLALFLCTASLVAGWPPSPLIWTVHLLLACSLLFQFRLWDDLDAVASDRHDHPERVLCQADSLTLFLVALGLSFVINLVLLLWLNSPVAVGIFLVLNLIILVWYHLAGKFKIHASVSYHVVLIKYPIFVLLLASVDLATQVGSLIYATAVVYFCFCVYELLHDPRLRSFPHHLLLLAAEMVALQLIAGLILVDLWDVGVLATIQGGLTITGAGLLLILFNRFKNPNPMGRWSYSVFLIAFVWLLNYSFASYPAMAFYDSCSTGILS